MRPVSFFFEGLDEVMGAAFSQIDGVPLKTVMDTRITDAKGKVSHSQTTTTITELREESVDPERFAVPEGFERRELGLAQGDGEKDGEGNKGLEALKGLFGRDRD